MTDPGPAPKVSVLMTLYNKGPYVAEAIQSVLAQTFTDFELLVVDDASTDDGLEVVKGFADARIRILESPVNTGRAAAANRGFDAARGEYVAVLDADDIAHPERLAKQVAYIDAHPGTGACGSWTNVVDAPDQMLRLPAEDAACRGRMLFGMPVIYGAALLRRSVLEEHGLRCDPDWRKPGMDYLFMLAIGRYSSYANLQEPLLSYRLGMNNMRHGRDEMADRIALEHETLRLFNIPATDAEVELHVAFLGHFAKPFTAARVRALWAWKQKLVALNRERKLFTVDLFEHELERRWNRLFHRIADLNLGAALAHMRISGSWPKDRLTYLAKATLNRWSGRH